jgi:hypothetical protein
LVTPPFRGKVPADLELLLGDVDPDHLTGCHASPVADCDRTWTTAHVVQDHIDQDAQ